MNVNIPYLIQRGRIISDVPNIVYLSKAVQLDYMGSSEFEFGALPRSLREMKRLQYQWSIRCIAECTENGNMLHVLSAFNDVEFEEYSTYIMYLRNYGYIKTRQHNFHPKESAEFSMFDRRPDPPKKVSKNAKRYAYVRQLADFWWDIDNGVMFSFNEDFMLNRLQLHLHC